MIIQVLALFNIYPEAQLVQIEVLPQIKHPVKQLLQVKVVLFKKDPNVQLQVLFVALKTKLFLQEEHVIPLVHVRQVDIHF